LTLGEIATFKRGTAITKKDTTEGPVPVIAGGRAPAYFHAEANRSGETITVAGSGVYAGYVGYWSEPVFVSDAFSVHPDPELFEPKFVYYFLSLKQDEIHKTKTGGGVPHVHGRNLAPLEIPVPPIAVQREIIGILDLFNELEAVLEAELDARRRQFVHYRDMLLAGGADRQWTTVESIATNLDWRRRPVAKSARTPGEIPYYGASGVVDYVSDYIFEGDYLLVSEDGANLLTRSSPIAFSVSGRAWINNHAHVLEFGTYAERRFVEIYLNSIDLAAYVTGGAQPKLNQANLNKIPIPAVPLSKQERIVSALDRFDALVNDLSVGLPAELNARRRQYEHYRDRLLTFPEAV